MKTTIVVFLLTISAAGQMTRPALLQLDGDFARATAEGHLDGWMKYMMASTVIFQVALPQLLRGPQFTEQMIVGKEEIRSYYQRMFAMPNFTMLWTPTDAQVLPSATIGFTKGTFRWTFLYQLCNCTLDWHGTYLAVWEQDPAEVAKWKLKALFPSLEASTACGCGG